MYTEINEDIIEFKELNGGYQIVYRFPNGYGASIVNHSFSYGTELGVIKFKSSIDMNDFGLTYETPITDDVLSYLSPEDIEETLNRIRALPALKS